MTWFLDAIERFSERSVSNNVEREVGEPFRKIHGPRVCFTFDAIQDIVHVPL